MPRGEHFKKDNPRINQVSFKVSDTELVQLKEIASKENLSVAEWLRGKITSLEQPTSNVEIVTAKPVAKVEPVKKVEEKKPEAVKPKVEKKIAKAKNYDQQEAKTEQMSLF